MSHIMSKGWVEKSGISNKWKMLDSVVDRKKRFGADSSVAALGMAKSLSLWVCPPLRSRLKYLNNRVMEYHDNLYRHSCSPEDESQWVCWSPVEFFFSTATSTLTFMASEWNASTAIGWIAVEFDTDTHIPVRIQLDWTFLTFHHHVMISVCLML